MGGTSPPPMVPACCDTLPPGVAVDTIIDYAVNQYSRDATSARLISSGVQLRSLYSRLGRENTSGLLAISSDI